ncbi:NAD-dependent epimerase [Halanaerobium hydrogeniformans]|uniref:NAD-dependent epimerase/dehydratase n=1 Tax=Halanaerobium hydrogeniformans TaxID=656519 RepID=E4RNM1_HALHG|nr:NAD-dependent epimerase [Halanaerobium hydrogeniformans]ADQ13556.1 NAD-dependent epimerase/dehydratase [Halanaerobium hydrogeniformans]
MSKTHLVTGAAGFIGFHTSKKLLEEGQQVIGLDNLNDYYSVQLKKDRLAILKEYDNFIFIKGDLENNKLVANTFAKYKPEIVINLAAQAGVRYSLKNPHSYIDSNLVGFMNILEGCRHHDVEHLIFASSSSVYGSNEKVPFSTTDNVDHPVSLYAATKKSNELMAHSYSHLYDLPVTGLRFFTVYGPWGRPDMALFIFAENMLKGKPIQVFNHGDMKRDFTYVDDVVKGIYKLTSLPAQPDNSWNGKDPNPGTSKAPYRIYNIGNNSPVNLMDFIECIEDELGIEAEKEFKPMQPGDVKMTYADVKDLIEDVGYKPETPLKTGVKRFIDWYREYYGF